MSYDDGSEVEIEVEEDDPPRNGRWRDSEDIIEHPTDDELAAGEFLGLAIDIGDDNDDGSQWGTIDRPTMRPEDFEALQ
jgi:hypothetical protein